MKIEVHPTPGPTRLQDMDKDIKADFYKAKELLFMLGYDEYVEIKSLPIHPGKENAFVPLATYRVKDRKGNYSFINIYGTFLGGALITDEY